MNLGASGCTCRAWGAPSRAHRNRRCCCSRVRILAAKSKVYESFRCLNQQLILRGKNMILQISWWWSGRSPDRIRCPIIRQFANRWRDQTIHCQTDLLIEIKENQNKSWLVWLLFPLFDLNRLPRLRGWGMWFSLMQSQDQLQERFWGGSSETTISFPNYDKLIEKVEAFFYFLWST